MSEHIEVYNPSNGQPYVTAPTPKNSDGSISTSDNSNKIATTEWVKSSCVNLSGNQSIGGTKTFTSVPVVQGGSPSYRIINTDITKGTVPTANEYGSVYVYDVNGAAESNAIGTFYGRANKNGNIDTGLRAYKPESGSSTSAELIVTYPASGYPYAVCPTPKDDSGNVNTSDNSTKIATTQWVTSKLSTADGVVPVGTVVAFAANSAPTGYLICNGATVSRKTYADLYAKIGDTYGAGDGSTTFALPNLTNKLIQGSDTAGTVKSAGLPNITGTIWSGRFLFSSNTSGFAKVEGETAMTPNAASGSAYHRLSLDASRCSSIYGNADTVQPPALTMRFYIKY